MQKWLLIVFLGLQVHFVASYLVPLDAQSQREFGGLLRWFWPWSQGDAGPLGQMSAAGFPLPGFFLAMATAGLFILAALAVLGIWVPFSWWRTLTIGGATLSIVLMLLFPGPTKLLPLIFDAAVFWVAFTHWPVLAAR